VTSTPRTLVLIDGFNLYNGLVEVYGKKYLWLNLESLARELLRDEPEDLHSVYYFSAGVRKDDPAVKRQRTYLGALKVHCLLTRQFIARFGPRDRYCSVCRTTTAGWEDKESDVSLGVQLVKAAALQRFDRAIVVSGDSDLQPAIEVARELAPSAVFIAAFPPGRVSNALRNEAGRAIHINESMLRRSLLPAAVRDGRREFKRPHSWQ